MILTLIRFLRLPVLLVLMASMVMAQDIKHPREGGLTGTGIVGVLNAKGIIEVGRVSVTLPSNLPIQTPLGASFVSDMRTGDMIAIKLGGTLQDPTALDAQQILQIIGPIARQSEDRLTVMGTTVFTANAAIETRVGEWVAVNGYWRDDGIVATRIAVVPAQDAVRIQGTYKALSAELGKIGETVIKGRLQTPFSKGEMVQVTGRYDQDALVVNTSKVGNFAHGVGTVLTQGYLSTPDNSGFYTVHGTGITSVTDQPEMINWQELMTVCGVDGELVTDPFFAAKHAALCEQ